MTEQQGSLPVEREDASDAQPSGIPLARPLHIPTGVSTIPRHDGLLLTGSSRLAALKDIGVLLVILMAFELYAGLAIARLMGVDELPVEVPDGELDRLIFLPALVVRASGVVAIIALILRHRGQPVRSIGLEARRIPANFLLGVATLAVSYALILAWQLSLLAAWPELADRMARNAQRIMGFVPRLRPAGFVLLSFLVGLYEEILFRGFLMTRLRRATGSWTLGVLLSTCLFAAAHMPFQEPVALAPITILSLVFSIVTIWRRSIVPAIVGHWLFDLSQFIGLYYWLGDSWT